MTRIPPRKYQFKKGQSGNPKGRPRKPSHNKDIHALWVLVLKAADDPKAMKRLQTIRRVLANERKNLSS
ncbi:MAG: hypothetical protein HN833_00420 [Elusimicrobiaceae bacterium]|jgi:hypothetical protein|nr:hypothetical protein [Elusimicrobiaceae bacterium]MBT3954832.1 hypothetical protein [Elusimicrobiaceae bacterium]MBT4008421.1 hypothetical protein [Elusimicrobiaceae bacterium]MBT4402949.1 hypothetical protein [Elusimicrobiaceae bacterium]MBT4439885.1 hypothetical protein [Elusimicrobiaceae bacterium]